MQQQSSLPGLTPATTSSPMQLADPEATAPVVTDVHDAAPPIDRDATINDALNRAVELHRDGDLKSAWLVYREIMQVAPDHPDAIHLAGVVAHQVGENESALELINQAIDLAPHVADYHNNLGEVLRATGEIKKAEASYRRALLADPKHTDAQAGLAEVAAERARALN